jgi:hypothetical protein
MVQQWRDTWADKKFCCEMDDYIAVRAAQWGADQELAACCEWIRSKDILEPAIDALRTARRPKPPTLKEQALSELNLTADPDGAELSRTQVELIRRALESL